MNVRESLNAYFVKLYDQYIPSSSVLTVTMVYGPSATVTAAIAQWYM